MRTCPKRKREMSHASSIGALVYALRVREYAHVQHNHPSIPALRHALYSRSGRYKRVLTTSKSSINIDVIHVLLCIQTKIHKGDEQLTGDVEKSEQERATEATDSRGETREMISRFCFWSVGQKSQCF